MAEKPFIAARIPEDLHQALNQHVDLTGENRTEALINALTQYLNFTPSTQPESKATTKIGILEERIARLEEMIMGKLEAQGIIASVISTDNTMESSIGSEDTALDNGPDNRNRNTDNKNVIDIDNVTEEGAATTEAQPTLFPISSTKIDGVMTNEEMATVMGLTTEGIKKRYQKGIPISHNGIEYNRKKEGRLVVWIPKTDDNVDNDDIVAF